ncbi:MAG: hypothetical protein Q8R39_00555 [bacterium]|nr:hypothetical protein [bacterium]
MTSAANQQGRRKLPMSAATPVDDLGETKTKINIVKELDDILHDYKSERFKLDTVAYHVSVPAGETEKERERLAKQTLKKCLWLVVNYLTLND